jgi:hypothetical protein
LDRWTVGPLEDASVCEKRQLAGSYRLYRLYRLYRRAVAAPSRRYQYNGRKDQRPDRGLGTTPTEMIRLPSQGVTVGDPRVLAQFADPGQTGIHTQTYGITRGKGAKVQNGATEQRAERMRQAAGQREEGETPRRRTPRRIDSAKRTNVASWVGYWSGFRTPIRRPGLDSRDGGENQGGW